MNSLREQKIELYLKRLTAQFFGMTRREKDEIRQEVRLHLEALIAMHEFEGNPEEETVESALHQFGDPRQIGKEMARSWWKKQKRQWAVEQTAREAAKPASQRRRERAIRWLDSVVGFAGINALIWMTTVHSSSGLVVGSWKRVLTVAVIWGLISGFVRAIHPDWAEPQPFQTSLQELKTEWEERDRRRLQPPPLPKDESLFQRLKRRLLLWLSGWTRQQRQSLLQQTTQPIPPLEWGKVMASIFWIGVVLTVLAMLPLEPSIKRAWVSGGVMLKVDSLSQLFWRRFMARRRSRLR